MMGVKLPQVFGPWALPALPPGAIGQVCLHAQLRGGDYIAWGGGSVATLGAANQVSSKGPT